MNGRFAGVEGRWQHRLGKLRDVVRQELVARQLRERLPAVPLRVLDVGCGQGTQAMRLARGGHRVTGFDASVELLGRFRDDLAVEPSEARERVRIVHGTLSELTDLFEPGSFDVVLCHGVLMYFDDPGPVLDAVATVVASGGLVSVLVRNGDGLAMRPGLLGDWGTALEAFGGTSYLNRMGVVARADRLDEFTGRLARYGMTVETWYGVRVFTDTAANDAVPPTGEQWETLISCEERAGRTDPYRRVAALLHVLARRDLRRASCPT